MKENNGRADKSKINMLIVDDEPQALEELGGLMEDNGFSVFLASNGNEAIEVWKKIPFNIGLLDFKLPDMDAIELIGNLRRGRPDAVYLLITAYASIETAIESIHAGVFDYIVKPFNPDELIAKVKNALIVEQAQAESRKTAETMMEEKSIFKQKFTRLMMSRETKMIELKREVNTLLKRLNEPEKYNL